MAQKFLNFLLFSSFFYFLFNFLLAWAYFLDYLKKKQQCCCLVKFDLIDGIIIAMIESSKSSKREQKHSKILQKQLQDLHREVQAMNRRSGGNNNESDSDNQLVDKKAKKWWSRFDQRHFVSIYQQEYYEIRDITTSNRILQISPKQSLALSTYPQEKIVNEYDLFAQRQLMHVLYKAPNYSLYALTSYQLQQTIPNYSEPKGEKETLNGLKITPSELDTKNDGNQLRQYKLSMVGINEDQDFCKFVEDYKQTMRLFSEKNEVQRDINFWKQQLNQVNRQNNNTWDRLIKSIKHQVKYVPASQTQIRRIKEYLMWLTVLKYFQHGHSDKSMEMLNILIQNEKLMRPAKSIDANKKKFFETDCKICFCSFNNDSNQVLYCDSCNTSFHLACYGLQQIPKEQTYYCDCCAFQKRYDYKKVICQICCKTNFPIKKLDGHFYHVTCLFLLNLAYIKGGEMVLREEMTHHKIVQMVVQSQVLLRQCQFCAKTPGSDYGYRIKCSFPGCSNCSHPVCAYINGCRYSVKRDKKNQKLEVKYYCNAHDTSRDWIQQTYIRRYMCNLKSTSAKKLEQFRQEFKDQIERKHQSKPIVKRFEPSRIIAKTRFLKKMFQKEDNKNSQNTQKIYTESRKMLQKYKKVK